MNTVKTLALASGLVIMTACGKTADTAPGNKPITSVKFSQVKVEDSFWSPRLELHRLETISVCIDQIENKTDRIRNYENAAKHEGKHSGIFFDDSDVYKAMEGMAYSLQLYPDKALEAKCDEWIDKIAAAQQEDGYINTYYTLTTNEPRWTDMDRHEMYCAGHMIEAAVAYYNVTGKRKFLDVAIRMAEHMMSVFGPGKRHWVPGHEEIELALVKLYETTGEKKYLDFSGWLLDQRGHGYGSYGDDRKWPVIYYQDEFPVRDLKAITGHAVRAMYLYSGMADVAAHTGDTRLMDALYRLWDHVIMKNMYITGGIGQSSRNEGITFDYDLPNLEAYCETCASVGMVLWNSRMFLMTGDSKYADIVEKSMYNGALAGINLSGNKFFYVNPLESLGNHHRQEWYGCACCPSQVCRFLPSIGGYIYGTSRGALWVNLFIGGEAAVKVGNKNIKVSQKTKYPWEGAVEITLAMQGTYKGQVRVRVPEWCKMYLFEINGEAVEPVIDKGYAVFERKWKDGDVIRYDMNMPVEVVAADPRVAADKGKRAVMRGPLVYCIEWQDNRDCFDEIRIDPNAKWMAVFQPDLCAGVVEISDGCAHYIPYYAWDNRMAGPMKVWVPLVEDYEDEQVQL